jgi:Zn-dependent protease
MFGSLLEDPQTRHTLMMVLVYVPVLLFSVSFHESAHGWAADRLGDPTARRLGRVSLNPFRHLDLYGSFLVPGFLILMRSPMVFGWAKPCPVDVSRLGDPHRDFSLVAGAGPASNFILALAFALAGWLLVGVLGIEPLAVVFQAGVVTNVALGFFNLLPLPTLDGIKLWYWALPRAWVFKLNRLEHFGAYLLLFIMAMSSVWPGLLQLLLYQPVAVLSSLLLRVGHLMS